jgi:hypothetical protein
VTTTTGPSSGLGEGATNGSRLDFASLPELLAIDLAFASVSIPGVELSRLLLIASSPTAISEALFRVSTPVSLVVESEEAAVSIQSLRAASLLGVDAEMDIFVAGDDLGAMPKRAHENAIWIAPERHTWRSRVRGIDAALSDRARLAIIGSGPLARLALASRPNSLKLCGNAANPRHVGQAFGYRTETTFAILGMRSALYGTMRLAADRIGRHDVADRLEAAYRLALIEPAASAGSAISVWTGRKAREGMHGGASPSAMNSVHDA